MTVGRSSFSGRASEHWSASWEIATCRVARVAATPSGTASEDEFLCGRGGRLNNCIPMECPPSPEARARALFSPRHPDRAETYKETDEPTYT